MEWQHLPVPLLSSILCPSLSIVQSPHSYIPSCGQSLRFSCSAAEGVTEECILRVLFLTLTDNNIQFETCKRSVRNVSFLRTYKSITVLICFGVTHKRVLFFFSMFQFNKQDRRVQNLNCFILTKENVIHSTHNHV